jgi:hypothetical protein
MNKLFFIALFFLYSLQVVAQQVVVNQKGTKTTIDSSKWTLSGTNIFNKNSGNVGIGNPLPTYKLDVTGKVRITDSLIVNTKSKFSDSLFITNAVVTKDLVSTGSFRGKVVRVTTSAYTVGSDDYIIHFTTSAAGTVTLPGTASSIGRVLKFSNHSGGTKTLSASYRTGSGTTANTIANNVEITITYDGTEWFVISN